MTDFDTEMMREDKLPLPVQAEKDPSRKPPQVMARDPALLAALEQRARDERAPIPGEELIAAAVPEREAAPENTDGLLAEGPLVGPIDRAKIPALASQRQDQPGSSGSQRKEAARSGGNAQAAEVPKGRQPQPKPASAAAGPKVRATQAEAAAHRALLLTRVLASLLTAPQPEQIAALLAAYHAAPAAEAVQAADAILALYLRAEVDLRRRIRPAATLALRTAADGPLAQALSARLGALVMVPAAVPAPAPAPPPGP